MVRVAVADVQGFEVEAFKHAADVWMVVDADHHLALAATHEVGHPLVVLERKVHAVAGGLPVRRVHVVKRVRTIIAFSTFKRGEVFDVSTGLALPAGREVFLDPQQVDGRSSRRGPSNLNNRQRLTLCGREAACANVRRLRSAQSCMRRQ